MPGQTQLVRPTNLLNASRYVLAATVTFGVLGNVLDWQRLGWHTAVSPAAQVMEAIACVVVLWRPRWGLAIALVPMLLTLGFGNMEADVLAPVIISAAFVAVARPAEAGIVVSIFVLYALLRGVQSAQGWGMTASYLVLLLPGLAAGAALRVLLLARRRGQGRMAVLEADTSRIRGEERTRLAAELRSLIAGVLAESRSVLDGAQRATEPAALRAAIHRVNDGCRAALVEIRALVGMLREDHTAKGHDEVIVGPTVSDALASLRDRLSSEGFPGTLEVPAEFDSLSRVTQSTIVKVVEEVVSTALAEGTKAQPEGRPDRGITVVAERRRGWLFLDAEYPAAIVPDPEHQRRMDRLGQRTETLGGGMRMVQREGRSFVRMELPLAFDPAADRAALVEEQAGYRWLTMGRLRGVLTMGLTMGGLITGARLPNAFLAGEQPWELVWEVAGFAVAGLLLWWPRVWALPALAAILGLLLTPHSDDLALSALLLVVCLQAAGVPRRWMAVLLGASASFVLLMAAVVDAGAVRERALVAAIVLVALPALIAARHFLASRRRHLAEMATLQATAEGIRNEERNLLARELHDVVAHHLSVATLQCMAYGDSVDRAELRTALDRMRRSMTGAEAEMELLSRIMSGSGDETGGEEAAIVRPSTVVGVLAETLRDNGFHVSASVDPATDDLPTPTLRTLTRVMQEGVTNILRYARREGTCALSLDVIGDEAVLQISSTMPPRRRVSGLSLGYGLAGIRERVDLLGGRFAVGPEDGDWVLRVALPAGR